MSYYSSLTYIFSCNKAEVIAIRFYCKKINSLCIIAINSTTIGNCNKKYHYNKPLQTNDLLHLKNIIIASEIFLAIIARSMK